MNKIQNILGCLAAGLMITAVDQAQAAGAFVSGDQLYTPLKISASATFIINGKKKKVNITEADIVEALGLPADTDLVWGLNDGEIWTADAKTKTLMDNLTQEGFFTIITSTTGSSDKGSTITYTGTTQVEIYSDPVFDSTTLDPAESEAASSNWIELSGDFSAKDTAGAPKNGLIKINTAENVKGLTGSIFVGEFSNSAVSGSGAFSSGGSGSVPAN